MESEIFDKAVGGMYTESKLVFFDTSTVLEDWDGEKPSYTNAKVNAEISKYVKAGWTPVSVTTSDNDMFTILFCR